MTYNITSTILLTCNKIRKITSQTDVKLNKHPCLLIFFGDELTYGMERKRRKRNRVANIQKITTDRCNR